VTLFNLLGFKIQVDWTWVFLAVLVTWSLAVGYFPLGHKGLSQATYWSMGVTGALGLFGSIILHELSHSIIARRYGIPIKSITLFIFGGVAQMDKEPPSAKAEFLMALVGPIASVLLALGFYCAQVIGTAQHVPEPVLAVFGYLTFLNGLLAAFNILPAFPLDGGRMFRAALWQWKHDLRWATQLASRVGAGFGLVLIGFGLLNLIGRNVVGGIWLILIGLFLRTAAHSAYQQLLTRRAFEGEPVRRFMTTSLVTVSPDLSVNQLVDEYIYRYLHDLFPVIKDSRLLGCVSSRQVRNVPREEWDRHTVRDLMTPCTDQNTIDAETDAIKALSLMNRTGNTRLLVREDNRLVGIIALKDILKFLSLKLDLEGVQ
jgi:Zn-dependent protease